ncbi:RimJ/RimL family protein N-acetyltransferase [Scopulibacillus daqui]|uniref:RimJ/RimL family protein N-acetyltransferase n=1 Tax=Scopulibacillus daqui TaxID=1469162 RepID=A0ABS2PWC5_9BACL|nr:GNAT family N-acetyltransferase [Scopulibacillus daqui]MBM7644231.1 RimJ/RimL family protein N-acetyltransferase [Scopulibacillus daqui]
MKIRQIQINDAEAYLRLRKQLDKETHFMFYKPGEKIDSIEEQEKKIQSIIGSGCSMIFVAESEDKLIGFAALFGNHLKYIRHRAFVVIGVLKDYQNQGIAKNLLKIVDEWAREHRMERLEITVMARNRRALGLYHSMGYHIEGMRRGALMIDNEHVDEFYMGKLLKR